ncbi:MAG TPA: hypothetical protein VIU61_27605 [Kofleriaceae bacterium]
MIARLALLAIVVPRLALAQQAPVPEPAPPAPPLAQIRDEKQLASALSTITNDPAIRVDDPATRPLAQALMIEGVKQLQAKAYDQALANFLEAYGKFPSPRILLNVASTLRDMGRLADAANTYQRYLLDPATGPERVAEVKELLLRLDEQLTILTVRVSPKGSEVSIDAGPFIAVGSALLTRVRPGLHMVRLRHNGLASEVTVNGFEGELKDVQAKVDPPATPPPAPPIATKPPAPPPERVDGWMITGEYAGTGTGNSRGVLTRNAGAPVAARIPIFETTDEGNAVVKYDDPISISSGLLGVVRIDGEGRGFAGGLGLAISRGRLEGDVMILRSNQTGAYLGLRYRILQGFFRPYVALGVPAFVFDHTLMDGTSETKLAVGVRGAGGLEVKINGHLSVQGDIGYERFFFVEGTRFDDRVWVPTIGVIGRL